ncbi:MAG: hypothetical protein ACE5ER_07810 [Nitrospinaceae bacterium]
MPNISDLIAALSREDSLVFPPNHQEARWLKEHLPQCRSLNQEGSTLWFTGGAPTAESIAAKQYPAGHTVFYTQKGNRFLFTDPQGHPLHEAEWGLDREAATPSPRLIRARMQIDFRQWVGIRPRAKKFSTHIDIKSQPGWEDMTLDDFRKGAAQAWNVPVSEVQYFYRDENFIPTGAGEYDVQLHKDSLYALADGTFSQAIFVSHMFAVNWERLDLIPVVELFQSTLPGSGGAIFEFIWGLHEDQSRTAPLPPLRYRGLPTYPSQEAFNIFKAFFEPKGPPNEDLFDVFMNLDRSHEIEWTPRPHPPWRYFDDKEKLSLTVQEGFLYKVCVWEDPVCLPYINPSRGAAGPCDRDLKVRGGRLVLRDGDRSREVPLSPEWRVGEDSGPSPERPVYAFGWQRFFDEGLPAADPRKLLYTVPFFPEGDADIDEASTQPLVVDQIVHYMEETPDMEARLNRIETVLVHTFDTVISGCVDCTRKRAYTVLFDDSEFAIKQAQLLWGHAASRDQLENLEDVHFLPERDHVETAYQRKYDMVFKWIPFMYRTDRETCEKILWSVAEALNPGGLLFLQGPGPLAGLFNHYKLEILKQDAVMDMPFYKQHLKMCPENGINGEMNVFFARRMAE